MKFNQAAFTLLGIGVHSAYASGNLRSAKVSSLAVSTGDGKSEESSGKGSRSMEEVHFCCTINFQDCYGDPFCNLTEPNCQTCGGIWFALDQDPTCLGRWQNGCISSSECCDGLTCVAFGDYNGCDLVEVDGPVELPTPSPVSSSNVAPTASPVSSTEEVPDVSNNNSGAASSFCCTNDFKTCQDGSYCNSEQLTCESNCGGFWILLDQNPNCLSRWTQCTFSSECCNGLKCVEFNGEGNYKACGQAEFDGTLIDESDGAFVDVTSNVSPSPVTVASPNTLPSVLQTSGPAEALTTSPVTASVVSSATSKSPITLPTNAPTESPNKEATMSPTNTPAASPTKTPTYSSVTASPIMVPQLGKSARATTTRYWDCSGGACGCGYQPNDAPPPRPNPSHCYSNAMFRAPNNNPFNAKFYGTAAVSEALGGTSFLGPACNKCWRLTGTSNINGSISTIVVRGANFCPKGNPACENGAFHFDIAAPGFDFLASSLSNKCNDLEPEFAVGLRSCENWRNPNPDCDCSVIMQPTLRAGCENFLSLQWDNVEVDFVEVTCPPELLVTPCRTDGTWPAEPIPDTCAFFPV